MLKQLFASCCIAILLSSCASQIAPTGGEKDIAPPVPARSNPPNLSLHFDASKINITFNEFIQAGDFASQVFFSPALNKQPQYRVHGKTLTITLNDTLKPATTYTVNFGNAVKDITEGNVMVNYQYVFSTGDFIDSMKIQGIIKGAEDGLPKENMLAMLYSNLSDSSVALERPAYYAHTDKSGHFELSHLKAGKYLLIGLQDQNADLMYGPGEEIAFLDSVIDIQDSLGFYNLRIFKPVAEIQKVMGTHAYRPGSATIAFAKPFSQLKVNLTEGEALRSVLQYNGARDTAFFFIDDVHSDSLRLAVQDGDFSDTVEVRMKPENEKEQVLLPKFTVASALKTGRSNSLLQQPDKPFQLLFSTPVISIEKDSMVLLSTDSFKTVNALPVHIETDTTTKRQRGSITFPFKEKTTYSAIIPDSLFQDLYGRMNDSISITFTTYEQSATGNLFLKIRTDSARNYFYELSNSSKEVIARAKLKQGLNELKFLSLPPGNYSLKVVDDLNNNNRWDTGNYWRHLQPEKIYNYTDEITLRANWDLELEMSVSAEQKPRSR